MPLPDSKVYLSSAGSGKTTQIVQDALACDGPVLITTYTDENVAQIRDRFFEIAGHVPLRVRIVGWYGFLLQDGVRPYQNQMGNAPRVKSINFDGGNRRRRKDDYFSGGLIHVDKVSEFAHECEKRSGGMISGRLARMYSRIFIDEVQDLAGYDLVFLEQLLRKGVPLTMAGDPRQGTFSTNASRKYAQYRKDDIHKWLATLQEASLVQMVEKSESHRCNQEICDFADALYPDLPKTKSTNSKRTGHDGVFEIKAADLAAYIAKYQPVCLRYRVDAKTLGISATNIGVSKGRTYDRVLIFPTKSFKEYLKTRDASADFDKTKLYIAVTRARFSVAFVIDL